MNPLKEPRLPADVAVMKTADAQLMIVPEGPPPNGPARYYATFTVAFRGGDTPRQPLGGVVTLAGLQGPPDTTRIAVEIAHRLQARADDVRILQVSRLH